MKKTPVKSNWMGARNEEEGTRNRHILCRFRKINVYWVFKYAQLSDLSLYRATMETVALQVNPNRNTRSDSNPIVPKISKYASFRKGAACEPTQPSQPSQPGLSIKFTASPSYTENLGRTRNIPIFFSSFTNIQTNFIAPAYCAVLLAAGSRSLEKTV
jgi:hypothetical protein